MQRFGRFWQGHGLWILVSYTVTVRPDFSYVGQIAYSADSQTVTNEGTFQVRDGFLIDTKTKSSDPHAQVPLITRLRIVRADAHQLICNENDDSGKTKIVLARMRYDA